MTRGKRRALRRRRELRWADIAAVGAATVLAGEFAARVRRLGEMMGGFVGSPEARQSHFQRLQRERAAGGPVPLRSFPP